jgi:hypothetical protein
LLEELTAGEIFLTLKTLQRMRVVCQVFRKEFQSNGLVEASVLGFVDNAHAPAAEFSRMR